MCGNVVKEGYRQKQSITNSGEKEQGNKDDKYVSEGNREVKSNTQSTRTEQRANPSHHEEAKGSLSHT